MKTIYWRFIGLAFLTICAVCVALVFVPNFPYMPTGGDPDAVAARAAVATLLVTIAGACAALITIWLSMKDYAAAHTPRLEVWYVDTGPIEPYKPFDVNIHLVNTGKSQARLRAGLLRRGKQNFRSEAYVLVTRDKLSLPHPKKPSYAADPNPGDTVVEVGQYRCWPFSSHIILSEDQYNSVINEKGPWSLYVIGLIKYGNGAAGGSDAHQRTLFCRKYDRKTRRFKTADDEAYEYMT